MLNNENVDFVINQFNYSAQGIVDALKSHIKQDKLIAEGKEAEAILETMKDFEVMS
jgi:hypothetical protein